MLYKNKIFLLLLALPIVTVMFSVTNQNSEVILTLEEVKELIAHLNLDLSIHSEKGLEEIINCVNNKAHCQHPDLIDEKAQKGLADFSPDLFYQDLQHNHKFKSLYHTNQESIVLMCQFITQNLFKHFFFILKVKKEL